MGQSYKSTEDVVVKTQDAPGLYLVNQVVPQSSLSADSASVS